MSHERSIIHKCWCLSVEIVLQLLREQRDLRQRVAATQCARETNFNDDLADVHREHILDIVTVFHYIFKYEKTICWAIEPFKYGERLTLASLEEMDCTCFQPDYNLRCAHN